MSLRSCREKAGYKQSQVADMIGISTAAISKLESGQNIPRVPTAIKLCVIYNCKFEELAEGEKWYNIDFS